MSRFEVIVNLKKEVLDPEGRTIKDTLNHLGYQQVTGIKVGRRYELEVADSVANPEQHVNEIAQEILANPVAQTFTVRRIDDSCPDSQPPASRT